MSLARFKLSVVLLSFIVCGQAAAFEPFSAQKIDVRGLERINVGTVYNYLPIELGSSVNVERTKQAIADLYATGFFYDVRLLREGSTLIVEVAERPSISSITIEGNDNMGSDDLLDALEGIGLAEGKIFDRSLLDRIQLDLQRQYFALGYYGVDVVSEVVDVDKNRVEINIQVQEGDVAQIRNINIVGNTVFEESLLLDQFELSALAEFSSSDQYSRPKLAADIEVLRSYYLNRGYINFDIVNTHVSITADRSSVFITIDIHEGEQHDISSVKLAGDLIVSEEEMLNLINISTGDTFSRKKMNQAIRAITDRLGQDGYAFANVNAAPVVDNERKRVGLTFFVDPGNRTYVRRINITGNEKTEGEVIRRELRQMEAAWLDPAKVERSRIRIQRLRFLGGVNIETPRVAGTNDQVDVNVSITEQPSGSLMVGLGYTDGAGMVLNASVSQENFMGTGKRVSAEVNTSQANTVYSFSHMNPYYTLDGVSRSLRAYYRETDTSQISSLGAYTKDTWGTSAVYGIPLTEYDTLTLGLEYEHILIKTNTSTPAFYTDYIDSNGYEFGLTKTVLGWSHDTRNRTVFPTKGFKQSISTDFVFPNSALTFYKLYSSTRWYSPITNFFTLSLNAEVSYGDAYGDTTDLPFFEKFYAGGARSVRGYRSSSLGPQENFSSVGGNLRTVANVEVVFPPPFALESSSVRMSVFFDTGNVFASLDDYESSALRDSVGISLLWLSPLGPLSFSLAEPLNDRAGDEIETFQFTLGTFF